MIPYDRRAESAILIQVNIANQVHKNRWMATDPYRHSYSDTYNVVEGVRKATLGPDAALGPSLCSPRPFRVIFTIMS